MPGTAHTVHTVTMIGCDIVHITGSDLEASTSPSSGDLQYGNYLYLASLRLQNRSASLSTYTLTFYQGGVGGGWDEIDQRTLAPGDSIDVVRNTLARLWGGNFRITVSPIPPAADTLLNIYAELVPYSMMVPVV